MNKQICTRGDKSYGRNEDGIVIESREAGETLISLSEELVWVEVGKT